ncbi:MAG: hypothetical protein UT48_C0002G0008 [Parcubacteria group bacterium GW2011_GWE2_39_37]|uniref:DUF4340 domain-containing protein n=1 Tax=Candidatus Falkowbacteria bacterium GW2011_GWF2_39_8 TaxID=1618642 RepID=A0A0G0PV34_9BACT|nr:MAG: hypothetical protein UT48_C0002G0008 [Parcubacteria group bacterium GW2011_GWE2_39_37]KKR32034.1 MAG: hypothetical protein UT64_C0044G0011 [Candidatus Falkowbacteria bacterium GW2011_GWF2_39_8]
MKKNIVLGIILLLLIVAGYLYNGPIKKLRQDSLKPENLFAKLQTENIDKIEVNNISILKKGDLWQVQGKKDFKASPSKISLALERLDEAKNSDVDLVGNNKEKKDVFNTGKNGTEVKLYNGKNLLLDFIIGKPTDGSYVSRANSAETYKIIGVDLNSAFEGVEWRDETIVSIDKEKINKLRIQLKDAEYSIEKKNGEWFAGAVKLNKEKVTKIVELVSNLRANEIPEQDFLPTGLDKSSVIVQATGEGINSTVMVANDNGKEMYYAKNAENDSIYLISKEDREGLNKKLDQLK